MILTFEYTYVCTLIGIVSVDAPIAEIADKQVAGEPAKISRSDGETPGRIQLAVGYKVFYQIAVRIEDCNEPVSLSVNIVFAGRIRLRVSHKQFSVQILDVEWGIVVGHLRVRKRTRERNWHEVSTEHVNLVLAEIRCINEIRSSVIPDRDALVDRARYSCTNLCHSRRGRRGSIRIPARDQPSFGRKDKQSGATIAP